MAKQILVDEELLGFSQGLADAARNIVSQYFRRTYSIDSKSDQTPVTVADREIEARMREMIAAQFPDHGIFGEEFGKTQADAHHVWVLDPIDGTRSFITGMPVFGTLISLLENRQPVFGMIEMPALGERWWGGVEIGARCNNERVVVSGCESIEDCRLATTSPGMFDAEQQKAVERVVDRTVNFRYGGDCYNYATLASGYLDLVIEADLKPYDFCALVPVVESAGGVITDWQGARLTLESTGEVIAAATPELHAQAVEILTG
ncbi:MAG: histidinol-phosphatase [Pseudomonadota bacterium]